MPLAELHCEQSRLSDLSPLEGTKLTAITFTPKNITKGLDVIRRTKSLKTIGPRWGTEFAPAEFWQKYDAGEFGK